MPQVGLIRLMTFALALKVNLLDRALSIDNLLAQGWFSAITSMARIEPIPKEKNL